MKLQKCYEQLLQVSQNVVHLLYLSTPWSVCLPVFYILCRFFLTFYSTYVVTVPQPTFHRFDIKLLAWQQWGFFVLVAHSVLKSEWQLCYGKLHINPGYCLVALNIQESPEWLGKLYHSVTVPWFMVRLAVFILIERKWHTQLIFPCNSKPTFFNWTKEWHWKGSI